MSKSNEVSSVIYRTYRVEIKASGGWKLAYSKSGTALKGLTYSDSLSYCSIFMSDSDVLSPCYEAIRVVLEPSAIQDRVVVQRIRLREPF